MLGARVGRLFARVWGLRPTDLRIEIHDPVGRGLLHEPRESTGPIASPRPDLVIIRPAWGSDHRRIDDVRRANREWLGQWEASLPPGTTEILPTIDEYAARMDADQRAGRALVMVVEVDGIIAGQFSVSNVHRGAMSQGMLGYWLTREWAGRGLGSLAAAVIIDLVIGELGLHRIEVDVRPENEPSLGLCRRLGLYAEGLKPRFMHINGQWADHLGFSIDAEALPEGGLVAHVWGRGIDE